MLLKLEPELDSVIHIVQYMLWICVSLSENETGSTDIDATLGLSHSVGRNPGIYNNRILPSRTLS